jgi:hypothetical protein
MALDRNGFYRHATDADGDALMCRDCIKDDASLLETEPLLIVVSTDDGREWINAGRPGDMTTLQEVTSPRTNTGTTHQTQEL